MNVVLSWRLVPVLPAAPRRAKGAPLVSIVVPARDEARDVGEATRSKLAQDDPAFEVVVVDDRSTDSTRSILRELEVSHPRLRVVEGVEPPVDWLGKPHALWQGACAASGEWLVFSDADVRFAPDLVSRALGYVEAEGLDFLTVFPALEAATWGERLLLPTIGTFGFCYFPGWLMNHPRATAFAGGAGVFNLIRRDWYDRIGGHEALRLSVVDDIQLGRRAKRAGARCRLVRALDSVRVRMYRGFFETVRGFTKNGYWGLGGHLVTAVPFLALFSLESLLPWIGLGSRPQAALAGAVLVLALAVRGVLHRLLGYPLGNVLLHPLWVAAVLFIFARSTFVNGVLRRNTWRGRVRDARTLHI